MMNYPTQQPKGFMLFNLEWTEITFSGRVPRRRYWLTFLIWFLVMIPLLFIPFVNIAVYIYSIVCSLSFAVRRLHDIGKSGVAYLICFVPFVGGIILLIWLCRNSDWGPNLYGPNPKPEQLRKRGLTPCPQCGGVGEVAPGQVCLHCIGRGYILPGVPAMPQPMPQPMPTPMPQPMAQQPMPMPIPQQPMPQQPIPTPVPQQPIAQQPITPQAAYPQAPAPQPTVLCPLCRGTGLNAAGALCPECQGKGIK